jgi:hypothetical protein
MTPIAAVPAAFLQYSRLQPRPKGFENRLTDAETARMVELQNANIRAEEKKLGRKLTNTEKLTIISSTQRNFWAGLMLPTGTPGGYMGPGTQSFNPQVPGQRLPQYPLDVVIGDKKQSPVPLIPEWWSQTNKQVRDMAQGVKLAAPPLLLAAVILGGLYLLTRRS